MNPNQQQGTVVQMELDLYTGWFLEEPPAFPLPWMQDVDPIAWTCLRYPSDLEVTITCSIVNLQNTTRYRITWSRSDPMNTLKVDREQAREFPLQEYLEQAKQYYNSEIVKRATSITGRVGDGGSWSFIEHVLNEVRTWCFDNNTIPVGLVKDHEDGCRILDVTFPEPPNSDVRRRQYARVRPGDILEYFNVQEEDRIHSEVVRHTAIIYELVGSVVCAVGQRRVGNVEFVDKEYLDLNRIAHGRVKIWRNMTHDFLFLLKLPPPPSMY